MVKWTSSLPLNCSFLLFTGCLLMSDSFMVRIRFGSGVGDTDKNRIGVKPEIGIGLVPAVGRQKLVTERIALFIGFILDIPAQIGAPQPEIHVTIQAR